jgi:hypothetical protein
MCRFEALCLLTPHSFEGKRVRSMLRALDKLVNREEKRGTEVAVAVGLPLTRGARSLRSRFELSCAGTGVKLELRFLGARWRHCYKLAKLRSKHTGHGSTPSGGSMSVIACGC